MKPMCWRDKVKEMKQNERLQEGLSCPVGPVGEVTLTTVLCKLQKARHEWDNALMYDNLTDSEEVIFSTGNPHARRYDELIAEYLSLREQLNLTITSIKI
jgi:hypothetical protein